MKKMFRHKGYSFVFNLTINEDERNLLTVDCIDYSTFSNHNTFSICESFNHQDLEETVHHCEERCRDFVESKFQPTIQERAVSLGFTENKPLIN